MHKLTRIKWRPWKRWQLSWFVRKYNVDMSIAVDPNLESYADFNSFFTRALKSDARPIAMDSRAIACPVDGAVSQAGPIKDGKIFQAKGMDYDLRSLLGGSTARAEPFRNGQFATLYLSPRDYHRIHMPLRGELVEMVYVPGRLFSVNPRTAANVPALFARNERVVAIFKTDHGPLAMILVGAMFVANIETKWAGVVAPNASNDIRVWNYENAHKTQEKIILDKGAEMGRFNMGSTVILLFGPGTMEWADNLTLGTAIQMGMEIGTLTSD